ncbi:V-type ATP synthase subunit E [Candidatus Nitrosocosmicus hydrocola]|jgi:vacuolar-type H+-ATPase subunit E/Vma4|uniref:V-type ATP synthase subunit E n=1 Tax=Candidatus Nitrosocosmicus hydrocola TaxID=1826872 RepID=UPI0011E5DE1D|nr:V-type ATP synthase subunit E family protein [Candidatus Nitrosocosmicus hydrocola]
MSALNTFDEEIQDRKKKELSILNSLLDDKKAKIEAIKAEKVKDIKEKYENEAENKSQREYSRITESARLESKKILFDVINTNMDSAFDSIKHELKSFTKKSEYKKTLERMVLFAKREFGDDVIIRCRESDITIVKDLKTNLGPQLSTIGGIIAVDKTGTRELDLTFEELLENHEDEIKNFLYEKMV